MSDFIMTKKCLKIIILIKFVIIIKNYVNLAPLVVDVLRSA